MLECIAYKFKGKYITINIIEQEFSILKSNIKFKGNRIIACWKLFFKILFHDERISRAGREDNTKSEIGERDGKKVDGARNKFNRKKVRKKSEKLKEMNIQ